ncbi:hypothetical protein ABT218_07285 [Streptomyces sp. NPDC001455]|uniref:hypothetical protein n=1 Tax=Streptomyces sp. NPDC001455 TaxID=3154518 RepID=UPI0033307419
MTTPDRLDEYQQIAAAETTAIGIVTTLTEISQMLSELQTTKRVTSTDGVHKADAQIIGAREALTRARERAQAVATDLREARIYTSGLRPVDDTETPTA